MKDITLLKMIPWVISSLTFALMFLVALSYHPKQYLEKAYDEISSQIQNRNRGLYDKIDKFLLANGAYYYYESWLNPINYLAIRIAVTAVAFSVGIQIKWYLSIIFAMIGFFLPKLYFIHKNRKDNIKMMPLIQSAYLSLIVQTKAGVYITDALAECYQNFQECRLTKALEEMSAEFYVNPSFENAIDHFNEKFNNESIDALCIILKQSQESGKAVKALEDMSLHLKDLKAERLSRKKDALDRSTTFCILVLLVTVLAVIIYALVSEMYGAVSTF